MLARHTVNLARASLLLALTGSSLSALAQDADYVDFAAFEHGGGCQELVDRAKAPGTADQIAAGLNNGTNWTQEKLDRLFACSKSGPIPDGFLDGRVIIAPDGAINKVGKYAKDLGIPFDDAKVKAFAEAIWKGKKFDKANGWLLNKIGSDTPILGKSYKGQWRFPAKLYCGQSQLDSRRESIIIDYLFTEQGPGYDKNIDWLAGGNTGPDRHAGLKVRDEIRMVTPGVYLGRAYMDRMFVLNFVLFKQGLVTPDENCYGGSLEAFQQQQG